MVQALLSGVSSIKAHQTRMSVIGNNLANVNTTAYKGARVGFQDLLSQTIEGATRPGATLGGQNPIQYGLGVKIGATDVNTEQGSLGATNRPTDLAIQGNGFFMVSMGDKPFFTRDGSFSLDANGDLVHRGTGAHVLGWTADPNGVVNTGAAVQGSSSIHIPIGGVGSVQATTRTQLKGNLSANAAATDSVTSSIQVYDSLGNKRDLTLVMTNRQAPAPAGAPTGATSSWEWTAYEGGVGGTQVGSSADTGNSPLYFDGNGQRVSGLAAGTFDKVNFAGVGGSDPMSVELDFDGIYSQAAASGIDFRSQNGYAPGSLSGLSIGSDGVITGIFTNGLNRVLGQVAVASFSNPQGMERASDNLWVPSENSGLPAVGTANTGDRGVINAGYLEGSNVDISSEFTDLIVTQRGFQANTKVVTTVDQMLEELINIRR